MKEDGEMAECMGVDDKVGAAHVCCSVQGSNMLAATDTQRRQE